MATFITSSLLILYRKPPATGGSLPEPAVRCASKRRDPGRGGVRTEARSMRIQIRITPGANSGCHLKTKLATSVSTTSRAVAVGGDVKAALLIDEVHEGFGFLGWSRVDMAQQAIQRE